MSASTIDFAAQVEQLQRRSSVQRTKTGAPRDAAAFERALEIATRRDARRSDPTGASAELRFSRHAAARLESRGIQLSEQEVADLGSAVDRLHAKGARESLLLMADHAFVVGVPRRTIITAMTRDEAVGSIFTNIDSTMVLR